jgi:hypothetical protein
MELDCFLQGGTYLFKGKRLYTPRCSLHENLIMELDNRRLAGPFGIYKTQSLLEEIYCWSNSREEVGKYVERCRICQGALATKSEHYIICLMHVSRVP